MAQYFCQFYLAQGYDDPLEKDLFLCTFSMGDGLDKLEKHHIIPLKSAQSIAESEKKLGQENEKNNIVNSPLNRIYITKKNNKIIASKDFASYLNYLMPGAVAGLDLPANPKSILEADIRTILSDRHDRIRNRLQDKTQEWLREWKRAEEPQAV